MWRGKHVQAPIPRTAPRRYAYLQGPDGRFRNPFNRGCKQNCKDACWPESAPPAPVVLGSAAADLAPPMGLAPPQGVVVADEWPGSSSRFVRKGFREQELGVV